MVDISCTLGNLRVILVSMCESRIYKETGCTDERMDVVARFVLGILAANHLAYAVVVNPIEVRTMSETVS